MKKKLVVIGMMGMLGHTLFKLAEEQDRFDVYGTQLEESHNDHVFFLDLKDFESVVELMKKIKPDVVINCAALLTITDKEEVLLINSLAPKILASACDAVGAKFVHISTDNVFLGDKGNYKETDIPNPQDFYSMSKLLGEVTYAPHLTIRTSIIGKEIGTHNGLLSWFLSQKGEVNGYDQAYFSGITTLELSRILLMLCEKEVYGLLHIGGERIDKYTLCCMIQDAFGKNDVLVHKDSSVRYDRSLNSDKMKQFGIMVKPLKEQLLELQKV